MKSLPDIRSSINIPHLVDEFQNFYRSSPNGLCLLDKDLRYIRLNKRLGEIYGKPVAEHIGHRVDSVNPEIASDIEAICNKVIETGDPLIEKEIQYKQKDASAQTSVLRASCFPITNDKGSITAFNMIVQDITAIKRAQQQIEDRLNFETFLSELSARFVNVRSRSVDKDIIHGLQSIAEFLDVDRAEFLEVTEEKKLKLMFTYTHPEFKPSYNLPGRHPVLDDTLPWYAQKLLRGEISMMSNPSDLPIDARKEREYCNRAGLKSSLTIPLSVGGSLKYTISLDSFHSYIDWSEKLVSRIRMIGEIFANSLARKRSDERLRNAFSEIKTIKNKIEAEWSYLQEEIKLEHNFEEIVGRSKELKYVLFKLEQIAPTASTVLILGETGTGKELVARALHHLSPRKNRPMVKLNCATLPSNLIESELFGHEKGAFSGAHARRVGRFELANESTIFLDEIGELPLELQPKLLRVLQDGEFERLGSVRSMKTDVRIIAATNRKLKKEVKKGRFREDLWYRLHVFPITMPPLRQRKDDIALLAKFFTQKLSKKMGKEIKRIPAKTLNVLEGYSWPGNVRELENVIERAVINSQNAVLKLADDLGGLQESNIEESKLKTLAEYDRDYISQILKITNGKIYGPKGAATILGLNPETLRSRMRKLGLKSSSSRK